MFVNVDWFFLSHRLVIANAAKSYNIDITVYADITNQQNNINKRSFDLLQSPLNRVTKYFSYEFIEILKAIFLIKKNKPDLIHAVTIKPIVLLGIASRLTKVPFIGAVTGLGPAFSLTGWKSKLRLKLILIIYTFILKSPKSALICQNKNDIEILLKYKICDKKQIFLVNGSGVNLEKYSPIWANHKEKPFILMASRILTDKGVLEFCAAAKLLIEKYKCNVKFKIAGPIDRHSPNCILEKKLNEICSGSGVEYLGDRNDLNVLLASAKIFVYPSYYPEGIPKVLLEAAASGTPVLTTDHPGCRDAIIIGKTGLTVEPKNIQELASTILQMLNDNNLSNMGIEGRKLAVEQFDEKQVVKKHYEIYSKFL